MVLRSMLEAAYWSALDLLERARGPIVVVLYLIVGNNVQVPRCGIKHGVKELALVLARLEVCVVHDTS